MLALFLSGEFLLHIPCWLYFYLGSFSYTSRAGFIFIWGVSHTDPVLSSVLCKEFLLHIPCWLLFFICGVSLTYPMLVLLFIGEVTLAFVFIWGGLLQSPCCLHFYLGSLSYTSCAGFFFHRGSFSYTSHAGFVFILGVSLTHPVLVSHLSGVSLTHPMLAFIFCGEFLLHIIIIHTFSIALFPAERAQRACIPCCLHFYLGTFSYTSRAGFTFIWGVSLTHPELS